MAIISRNAQGYLFGLTRQAGAPQGTLTGTLQQASLLQDLVITTDQFTELTNVRVAGQNLLVSNQPANAAGALQISQLLALLGRFNALSNVPSCSVVSSSQLVKTPMMSPSEASPLTTLSSFLGQRVQRVNLERWLV